MGVTIHFEGTAKSISDRDKIISLAKDFAVKNNMPYMAIDEKDTKLSRTIDEKDADYQGAAYGVSIQPHHNCEEFRLEFGTDLFMQSYCKTQFAPIEIHISLIALLKSIQPFFTSIVVFDEGEYWETNNKETLQGHIDWIDTEIERLKAEDKTLEGPVRLSNGRIADYIQ